MYHCQCWRHTLMEAYTDAENHAKVSKRYFWKFAKVALPHLWLMFPSHFFHNYWTCWSIVVHDSPIVQVFHLFPMVVWYFAQWPFPVYDDIVEVSQHSAFGHFRCWFFFNCIWFISYYLVRHCRIGWVFGLACFPSASSSGERSVLASSAEVVRVDSSFGTSYPRLKYSLLSATFD